MLKLLLLAIPPLLFLSAGIASAHQGHTSCKAAGQLTASEARAGTLVEEIHGFGPGNVDDVVGAFHTGGTFNGQTIEPLCDPK